MANGHLFILMLFAGIGIPVMAMLNASLGQHLGNPFAAVVILSIVALAGSALLLGITPAPSWTGLKSAPPFTFAAGLLFLLYIGSITYSAPQIGLANAVLMVIVGQLICSAVIDHFGIGGALQIPLDLKRLAGFGLIGIGLYLAIAR